jgi:hypothetical protein
VTISATTSGFAVSTMPFEHTGRVPEGEARKVLARAPPLTHGLG